MSSLTDVINKLKKLPQQRLAQALVTLLLIYIASILANISYLAMPGSHSAAVLSTPSGVPGAHNTAQSGVNMSSLTALDLFGSYAKPSEAPKKVESVAVNTDAPETSLNLTLSATVAEGNNSGLGTAIIQSSGGQGTYGIDDRIEGTPAILKQVFSDRVIIQNGMRHETLMLDGVEYDRMNVPRPVENSDEGDLKLNDEQDRMNDDGEQKYDDDENRQKVDRREDERLSRRLAEERQAVFENPTKIYDLIRFSPVRKGGELVGYRLNPGKEPRLFKMAGFRPNDLAVEVNGKELNNIKAAMQVLQDLREMTEANIVVEREGVRTEILFSLDSGHDNAPQDEGIKQEQHRGLVEQQ